MAAVSVPVEPYPAGCFSLSSWRLMPQVQQRRRLSQKEKALPPISWKFSNKSGTLDWPV